ncbi:hypothetical protein NVI2019_PEGOAJLN_02500 [Providencia alcalifaciens]|uniref:hypothetical protein n=1 Tax=Providencia alcalifaciens TaxID=126385 RepID=UPI0004494A54|nr:hypothetical protein [Providencia alcalifaciens]EUD03020.1 hypothetical protein HMPREF1565_3149 [Providencia alcalifaciens RIMD 1656011]CAG9425420.1 hypothetical protein NVI2019_PEGOAJLN_02500 [Providencia alcalifaciens]
MSGTQKNVDLHKEIDEIAEKAIEAFELSYVKTAHSNLHDPLLRWCDFLLRYIAPTKRTILKSDRFPIDISDEAKVGLQRIEDLFIAGGDVNSYQSKTLTLFNDTSGKKEKKRTDGLWADWDIHHLHLPLDPVDSGKKYSERSEWILFLKVYNNAVLFIDIKHHDRDIEPDLFSQRDLMETFIRNWPEQAELYEMKGILGLANNISITDSDIANIRNNGISMPFEMDGKVYAPIGMGMTTAVTATRVSLYSNKISYYAREMEKVLMDEEKLFMKELKSRGIDTPEFQIMMLDNGGLGIHEKGANMVWKFPRENSDEPNDLFCLFNNFLMPAWAGPVVIKYWKNHP